MKHVVAPWLVVVLCTVVPSVARADAILFASSFSTTGTFTCSKAISCSGAGTDTLVLGTPDSFATLTFTGVDTTFDVTNAAVPITLGAFELTASPGFVFPVHFANPGELPIVFFSLALAQTAPIPEAGSLRWGFGPGGQADLPLKKGNAYMTLRTGDPAYPELIYTIHPFPVLLHANARTPLTARVGAVPEPATLVLIAGGLAGGLLRGRRPSRR
jgi:hypothetical protein